MLTSSGAILTTHVGSLPRGTDGTALGAAGQQDAASLSQAVRDVVQQQVETGLDIVNDGEVSKPGFVSYVFDRLSGFEAAGRRHAGPWWAGSREAASFPDYYEAAERASPHYAHDVRRVTCTGPIRYIGQERLNTDLQNLKAAADQAGAKEAFMTSCSPSNIEDVQPNEYYESQEDYLSAIAEALREEYSLIVQSGLVLQIDDPRLVTHFTMTPAATIEDTRKWAALRVEALNYALSGLPEDRIRFHTCYSIDVGPRVHDMELKDIIDVILSVNAGAYSFEAANPRHEHEWRVWQEVSLPEDKCIVPGVITQSTVLVEHPETIADRIERFASVVGRDRVIAGADCGFASNATAEVFPSVVWAKLEALVKGAALASSRLWRKPM